MQELRRFTINNKQMGTNCSKSTRVIVPTSEQWKPDARSSPSNSSAANSGSTIRTLTDASIWNPFRLDLTEAEELLSKAEPGAFIFSHDVTSELFLSISMGNYVCHHAILSRDHGYYVGARRFSTIGAVVDYFKDNPLGETFLKQEFKSPLPKCTSQVQIKQHPDINISFPPLVPKNDEYELFAEGETLRTLQQTSCANESKSVITTQTSYCKSVHDETSETQDSHLHVSMQIRKQRGCSKITTDSTLKRLTRSIAFDKAETSGEIQEACFSPIVIQRSPVMKS